MNSVLLEKLILCSAYEEIPHHLLIPNVHYHVHKSTLTIPILSQMKPNHTLQPYFPNNTNYQQMFPHFPITSPYINHSDFPHEGL